MKEFDEEKRFEMNVKKELSQKLNFMRQKYEDEYKSFPKLFLITFPSTDGK